MQKTNLPRGERSEERLLARLLELRRLMRQTGIGPREALALLASQLRTFEAHQREEEAAEHLPYPRWHYGLPP